MAPADGRTSPSFRELRRAARLAAVQALFEMEFSGLGAKAVIAEFRDHRFGVAPGEEEGFSTPPDVDEAFFAELVMGAAERQREVDPLMNAHLQKGWPLKRVDSTLRALFRAAGFELLARKDIPYGVVIDEYVDVADAFVDAEARAFVNAVLDAAARQLRADEIGVAAASKADQVSKTD